MHIWFSKTFGDFAKPNSATAEEWNLFKIQSNQKSKFVYWFTEAFLDKLQNIFLFPYDVYNTVKIRPYRKDPIDESGLLKFYDETKLFSGSKISPEWKNVMDLSHKIEQEQYDEDSKMMKKLIDVRNGLWT